VSTLNPWAVQAELVCLLLIYPNCVAMAKEQPEVSIPHKRRNEFRPAKHGDMPDFWTAGNSSN
jgi:hypothetical protein